MLKKFILLFLALSLLAGVFSAVSIVASAETVEPQMSIAYCNLSFRDTVCIKYAVASNVSDVKILIWTSPEAEYTVGTHDSEITKYYTENIGGVPHMVFDYTELSAKQMTDVVYARAYAKVDGVDYYSDVSKYSILQYAYNKLATSSDEELKELLTNMLAYGATAQKYFDYKEDRLPTADWYQIKVVGGLLDDGSSAGLYLSGDKVTLIAPDTDADGKTFSHWVDDNGNLAAYEVIVDSKNVIYTSVYVDLQIESKGLAFTSNGDGTCYVNGIGTCTDTDIVIPTKSPAGDMVTGIGAKAFLGCSGLTSVMIPDIVTSTGEAAFSGCSSLESITIPFVGGSRKVESDTYQYPFGYIFGTNSYTGGISTTQSYHGSSTTSTTSSTYYIPETLKSVTVTGGNILYGAFYKCTRLTSVTILDSVTSIGDYAFYNCSGLTSVTLPDSVTSIGDYAFYNCSGLTSVTLPDSVTSIGKSAFGDCSGLTSVTLPDSVTSIGKSAFSSCSGLTSVTIGDSVTSIGDYAFAWCRDLTSVAIPDSVESIGEFAFYGCTGLASVTLGEGVTIIDSQAFYSCSGLVSITIPASVTHLGAAVFGNCTSLESITFIDTSTWYRTSESNYWNNMTGGQYESVNNPSYNVKCFGWSYYWYKK